MSCSPAQPPLGSPAKMDEGDEGVFSAERLKSSVRAGVVKDGDSFDDTGLSTPAPIVRGRKRGSAGRTLSSGGFSNTPSSPPPPLGVSRLESASVVGDVGAAPPSRVILSVETRGETTGRTVRLTQRELRVVGGNKVQTRIEVLDSELPESPVVFSVKHTHDHSWEKQVIVHKNLLLACYLAGLPEPPVVVPRDSQRLFSSMENLNHMYSYMERVLPHIRYPYGAPPEVRLYWWRATENGATVIQNESTGRIIAILNKSRKLPSAGDTLSKALTLLRNFVYLQAEIKVGVPTHEMLQCPGALFFLPDPKYPSELSQEEIENLGSHDRLSEDELRYTIQRWAVEQRISPWITQLVIRTRGIRRSDVTHFRYSIDVDTSDPNALSIQVHSNKPFSRELQAFPVCMLTMVPQSNQLEHVRLCFLRSEWFLKKLFTIHKNSVEEKTTTSGSANPFLTSPVAGVRSLSAGVPRYPYTPNHLLTGGGGTGTGDAFPALPPPTRCVVPPDLTGQHKGVPPPKWKSSTRVA